MWEKNKKTWGHYGAYKSAYKHFIVEGKSIWLGVDINFLEALKEEEFECAAQEEENSSEQLLADVLYSSYLQVDLPDFWERYFQLPYSSRKILESFMEELNDKIYLHEGAIWRAVVAFITARTGMGLKKIAEMFSPFLLNQYNPEGAERRCYDRLKNAFGSVK